MQYYFYLIFAITFAAILISMNRNRSKKRLLLILISIALIIIFQSLRKWTVGTDIVTYLNFFDRLSSGSISDFSEEFSSVEKGFLIFNQIISSFTTDHQVFLSIVSATIFIPVGYVIYKNSVNIYLSLIILISFGIYNFTFSGIRQSIAIAITFISFELIKKKKWFWFIAVVLLASTFHKSALVFLIAYPLYYFKIEKKHFFFIMTFIAVVFVFKSLLLKLFVSSAFEKYDSSELLVSTGAYTMFLVMLLIYSLSIFIQKKEKTKFKSHLNQYSNYMLLAVIIQIAASESQTAMRAGYYFFIFMSLLIPEMIAINREKKMRYNFTVITIIISLTFYYLTTSSTTLNPYVFFWE